MRDEITLDEIKADKRELSEAQKEIATLRETVSRLKNERHYIIPYRSRSNTIRFGAFSDPHTGSLYERFDALHEFYKLLKHEKIKHALCPGDVLDGVKMYKGQEFEQYATGFQSQLNALREKAPTEKQYGVMTEFITGNHDYSFYKQVGVKPGPAIAEATGWKYAGQDQKWVDITTEDGQTLTVLLVHPSGGTAYAISYKSQKYAESIPGGKKPDIVIIGHYHKADWLPMERNMHVFQAGCFQSQTPFMATKPTPAHVGGWIIEVTLGNRKHLTGRVKGEFIPFYEPEERIS